MWQAKPQATYFVQFFPGVVMVEGKPGSGGALAMVAQFSKVSAGLTTGMLPSGITPVTVNVCDEGPAGRLIFAAQEKGILVGCGLHGRSVEVMGMVMLDVSPMITGPLNGHGELFVTLNWNVQGSVTAQDSRGAIFSTVTLLGG